MWDSDIANHVDGHSPIALCDEYFDRTFITDFGVLISNLSNIEETYVVGVNLSLINFSDEQMTKDLIGVARVELRPIKFFPMNK